MHPRPTSRPWMAQCGTYSDTIRTRDRCIPLGLVKYEYVKLLGPYRVEPCKSTRLGLGLVTLPSRVYKGGQGPLSNNNSSSSKINTNQHTGHRVLRDLAVQTCLNHVP